MHTNETKDKFIELRLKGISLADISKKIGVSKTTLVDWNQRYADEIRALRSAELESLHARILQSYDDDFDQLRRIQSRLEARIKIDDFQFFQNGDQLVRSYNIIRTCGHLFKKDTLSAGPPAALTMSPSVGFCRLLTPKKGFFFMNGRPSRPPAKPCQSSFLKLYQAF